MADATLINGLQHGFQSLELKVAGEKYTGITAVSFGDKLEGAMAYGMGPNQGPRGQSPGKYVAEPLKLTMAVSSAKALRDQLAARSRSGSSYGQPFVPIVLQYLEPDDTPMTVEFERCRYSGDTNNHTEGSDAAMVDVEFTVQLIRRNGKTLFDESSR